MIKISKTIISKRNLIKTRIMSDLNLKNVRSAYNDRSAGLSDKGQFKIGIDFKET